EPAPATQRHNRLESHFVGKAGDGGDVSPGGFENPLHRRHRRRARHVGAEGTELQPAAAVEQRIGPRQRLKSFLLKAGRVRHGYSPISTFQVAITGSTVLIKGG